MQKLKRPKRKARPQINTTKFPRLKRAKAVQACKLKCEQQESDDSSGFTWLAVAIGLGMLLAKR